MAKVKIIWVSDSSDVTSCHFNSGRSFKESYIAHVFLRDGKWYSKHADGNEHGPHRNYSEARRFIENSVNGEPV